MPDHVSSGGDRRLYCHHRGRRRLLGGPRIRDVRVILTAPEGIRLVVVKVETDEPELYGLGCATFTQRPLAVATAIEQYLKPQVVGARCMTSKTSGRCLRSAPTGEAGRC